MGHWMSLVRRAMLAALILLPMPALAEITTQLDAETGDLTVSGLSIEERAGLISDNSRLRLQVAGLDTSRGMPLTLRESGDALIIAPRFALLRGTPYVLSLELGTRAHDIDIAFDAPQAPTPTLVGFAPSQSVIPENTLRLYLHFSEPMAQGQIRDLVALKRSDGTAVPSPFLTLGPELWDRSQTRVTLLFDPGRIKQGVGPNAEIGPPLIAGETYHLVIGGAMESAQGAPLGTDVTATFRVGPAERGAIDPAEWQILAPPSGSHAPLTIAFDRILDSGAARRLLQLQDPTGSTVHGAIETDGGGWSLTPETFWTPGTYTLVMDPAMEDVAGNRPGSSFDAEPGTMGIADAPVTLSIEINR